MNVLVINAGSSSLKYQLFDMETESILAKGNCDRIGLDGHLKHTPVSNDKPVFDSDIPLPTHAEAISAVIEKLSSDEYGVIGSLSEINAVGHRAVHGGRRFFASALIDDEVVEALGDCIRLAPLHVPANLMGINACRESMPNVPQVAVFDTSFHHTIPESAYMYPIPYKYFEENDIRRYGFHGTSHRYVSAIALENLDIKDGCSRLITCHLGNGASLAAIKDGKSIDTTMGVTPLEGVPMGTRCGSVDPSLIDIIAAIDDSSLKDTMDILNKKSGVLGIYGKSSDFRDIEAAAGIDAATGNRKENASVDKRAALALDVFCYQVAKFIGSYIVALGGLDALIFTAGIGENSPYIRKAVCQLLGGIGISIDAEKNTVRASDFLDVTGEGSKSKVFVIPTNEELVIARDTIELIKK
ncbi:MAG: acetate kinase [Oscillospiraceae bacterium]|jgi:acetate kinase|nr:acetate kinase [Oscillospiraceae bacterium]